MAEELKEFTTQKRTVQKKYSQDELDAIVAEASRKAAEEAVKNYAQTHATPTVLQVAKEEYVTVLYIGAIAKGTNVILPDWGIITYAGGTLDVPKKEFLRGLGRPVISALLKKRRLIVVNGLTDEEKKRYGIAYGKDDVLTQEKFLSLLDYTQEILTDIFSKLCKEHQLIVAKIFMDAYFDKNDPRVNIETVKKLNELSKKNDPKGMFTSILEDYGKKFAE